MSRRRSIRDSYNEQSPYNGSRKRKSSASLYSVDDSGIGYRSAPDYLKRLLNTSIASNASSVRSVTRTHSASEMTPHNNSSSIGNPKYKAQEDYYDEIQSLKKELKYIKDDNSNLRAKIRRLEEDNTRRCKEIDNLYDPTKNGDLRRTLTSSSTPTANVVMNLKQRIFKLELQLKQRETTIDEMKNDPRWTKGTELEIQIRALFSELEKQKLERLNFVQNDYGTSLDEETKNAIRKLETDKRELRLENENLKKKVDELEIPEHGGRLSARKHDGSTDKPLPRKIEDLKETCEHYEKELDDMKDDLKQMRRERDKYRDKYDNAREELEDIKRDRGQPSHKLDRQTNRSPSFYKHDDRYDSKQSQSNIARRRNSSSSEERSKKDSKSDASIRRSNEHIGPRSSLMKFDRHTSSPSIPKKSTSSLRTSSRNLRRSDWTSDDENRVKHFRENHAATTIQRGWRKHKKPSRNSFTNKHRLDNFDQRNSRIGGIKPSDTQSPRGSQQKLGSKIDNFGSGMIKNRPSSSSISNESALKTVQASLRGYINRSEVNQPSRTPASRHTGSDDDVSEGLSRPFGSSYGNERKRESFLNNSKKSFGDIHDKFGSNNRLPANPRDSISKFRRSPSPPLDGHRASSPRIPNGSGSKQTLPNDRNNLGSGNRFALNDAPPGDSHRSASPRLSSATGLRQSFLNDRNKLGSEDRLASNGRESPSKQHRSLSPPADAYRSASPRFNSVIDPKQSLLFDKYKLNSGTRVDRDSLLKLQRSTSPPNDRRQHISPENIRPVSRQSNSSLRKSPTNSKQTLKNTHNDDDDDVSGF